MWGQLRRGQRLYARAAKHHTGRLIRRCCRDRRFYGSPWLDYSFSFVFNWNATGLATINSASVTIQSGSVGRRSGDSSGFGFATVSANASGLGDFLATATGITSGGSVEESIKHHVFDVSSFVTAGSADILTIVIDGTQLTDPIDLFALGYAELNVEGDDVVVPVPASWSLLGLGIAVLSVLRRTRHG